jgi:hypothetical protein
MELAKLAEKEGTQLDVRGLAFDVGVLLYERGEGDSAKPPPEDSSQAREDTSGRD